MSIPIPSSLPLVSTGGGCCAPTTPSEATSAVFVDEDTATPSSSAVYKVTAVTCRRCASHTADAVRALPQLNNVDFHMDTGDIPAATTIGAASPETGRHALDDAGYIVSFS